VIDKLVELVAHANHVYLCGNGGSAANAIHIANDLVSTGIKAYPLTADIATLTAIANDFDYTDIFSRQLQVFGVSGDLLIALSGSGRSRNILRAIRTAKLQKMKTVAIFGTFKKRGRIVDSRMLPRGKHGGVSLSRNYQEDYRGCV